MTVAFELDGQAFVALNGGPCSRSRRPCRSSSTAGTGRNRPLLGAPVGRRRRACAAVRLAARPLRRVVAGRAGADERADDGRSGRAERVMAQVMTMKKLDLGALQRAAAGRPGGGCRREPANRRQGRASPVGGRNGRQAGGGPSRIRRVWSRKRWPPYAVLGPDGVGRRDRAPGGIDRHRFDLDDRHAPARARSAGSPRVSTQRKVTLAGKSRARRVCVDPFHASRRAIVPGCGASGACAPGGRAGVPAQPALSAQASNSNGTSG